MYIRLAFSVAAHLETDILILDEILSVGDQEFQQKCLNKMEQICHDQGRTIIYVSHALPTIERMCSNGIYLKNGKILVNGKIKEVIKKYTDDLGAKI